MRKNLIISVALVLLINGCGSNAKDNTPELVTVPESNGQGVVVAGESVGSQEESNISIDGNNSVGEFVTTANVFIPQGTQAKDYRGNPTCIENPCVIKCEQKAPNNVSACSKSEWKRVIEDVDLPADHVALYSGTLDVTEENDKVLVNLDATVTIKVPETAYWPESTRWDKIHGVGCAKMQVWVTSSCNATEGRWVETTIVEACPSGAGKTITIDVGALPAHIVMFVTMPKNHPNLVGCCTGGSK